MYRKHHSVVELVNQAAVIALYADTGRSEIFRFVTFRQCQLGQCLPTFGRPTEPIFLNRGIFQSPAPEISIADCPSFIVLQTFLEELLGEIHHQIQALATLSCSYSFRAFLLFPHLDSVFFRKISERFRIR